MTSVQEAVDNHRAVNDTFLAHAQVELDRGDLLQASEKAWGALAHYVKAIAKKRGWSNRSHADVVEVAQGLVETTLDPSKQMSNFLSVRSLHGNFYEDEFGADAVQEGIDDARDLLSALKEAEPHFPIQRPCRRRKRLPR